MRVSGTFIDIVLAGGFGAGAGSGVLQASLPHGSILAEKRPPDTAGGGGCETGSFLGAERLKTEFMSDAGGGDVVAGGGGEVAVDDPMPPDKSNKSFDAEGAGLCDTDGFAAETNEKSNPFDEED